MTAEIKEWVRKAIAKRDAHRADQGTPKEDLLWLNLGNPSGEMSDEASENGRAGLSGHQDSKNTGIANPR